MSMPFLQDPATSVNTIGLSIVSGLICSVCASILFRSAFAEQLGHRFMSNDSAIQYMTRRSRLLFIVSVLNVGESLRNGIQSTLLYINTTRPNFFVIRVMYLCTFGLSLPLQAYATCQRCAVIVTKEPVQRQRFLLVTFWVILICWLVFEGGLIKYIVIVASKGSSASDQEWFSTSHHGIDSVGIVGQFAKWVTGWPIEA
ncbi:hypothetical protein BCR44DRAFT_1458942 [Catenaria anguillulae PL171]|uniref:Uncharacterized protein n=1 Tax=Catenaria anguillulae PL171 TaxID=765915 RepID=A0A1Y2HVB3_9FUNG|nr:hypothetical protein BCR44DRAFT_1458942 [Catenaria anguillulae PL171]